MPPPGPDEWIRLSREWGPDADGFHKFSGWCQGKACLVGLVKLGAAGPALGF